MGSQNHGHSPPSSLPSIAIVVGVRPQLIKAAVLVPSLSRSFRLLLIHSGQHYDSNLSDVFIRELGLRCPDHSLASGSLSHGKQTGKMMEEIERVLDQEKPRAVLVIGDTNTTLAASLTTAKMNIPLAHVEAGVRSGDRSMPEEVNRILTDHCSVWHFCPTENAVNNLRQEGIRDAFFSGDLMLDIWMHTVPRLLNERSGLIRKPEMPFCLCTVHRPENTEDESRLRSIAEGLVQSGCRIVFPVHPRTRKAFQRYKIWDNLEKAGNIQLREPVGFIEMAWLISRSWKVITDSGGLQREAYFNEKPCVTLRCNTEWPETLLEDQNVLAGTDARSIVEAIRRPQENRARVYLFGDGKASARIEEFLSARLG